MINALLRPVSGGVLAAMLCVPSVASATDSGNASLPISMSYLVNQLSSWSQEMLSLSDDLARSEAYGIESSPSFIESIRARLLINALRTERDDLRLKTQRLRSERDQLQEETDQSRLEMDRLNATLTGASERVSELEPLKADRKVLDDHYYGCMLFYRPGTNEYLTSFEYNINDPVIYKLYTSYPDAAFKGRYQCVISGFFNATPCNNTNSDSNKYVTFTSPVPGGRNFYSLDSSRAITTTLQIDGNSYSISHGTSRESGQLANDGSRWTDIPYVIMAVRPSGNHYVTFNDLELVTAGQSYHYLIVTFSLANNGTVTINNSYDGSSRDDEVVLGSTVKKVVAKYTEHLYDRFTRIEAGTLTEEGLPDCN